MFMFVSFIMFSMCRLLLTAIFKFLFTNISPENLPLCSDFSPPASPLSVLHPSLPLDGDLFGEQERVPAWDWNAAWMGEMEAKVRAHRPVHSSSSRSFDV